MTDEKGVARRLIEEAFNDGRLETIDELVASESVGHDPALAGPTRGPDGMKQVVTGYRGAFSDLKVTIEDQLSEGGRVTTRWTAHGTHDGELFGIEPTGKEATVTGITVDRVESGRIVESWSNWDTLGLMQQLGVVPSMERTT